MNQILISNIFRTSDGDDLGHSTGRSWDKALASGRRTPGRGTLRETSQKSLLCLLFAMVIENKRLF